MAATFAPNTRLGGLAGVFKEIKLANDRNDGNSGFLRSFYQ